MIVFYSESEKVPGILERIGEYEFRLVNNQRELAAALVEGAELWLAFIHLESAGKDWENFLVSLRKAFPLLEICLLLYPGESLQIDGVDTIEFSEESLAETVKKHLSHLHAQNRRKHQRFDWPLQGRLVIPGQLNERFRVRSISSTGAFLESESVYPEANKEGTIRISFQDFNILAGCKVVNRREASEQLPAGFGVEFTDLTEPSQHVIDGMVRDALLGSLLEPDKPPPPPSIT